MTKRCSRCHQEKPVSDFSIKKYSNTGKPQYQAACRPCNKEYQRRHYQQNKEAYRQKEKRRREGLRAELAAYKQTHPCVDCGGVFHHAAMQFDHLPDAKKLNNISRLVGNVGQIRLEEELAKCELVCANCHAVRTWQRAERVPAEAETQQSEQEIEAIIARWQRGAVE